MEMVQLNLWLFFFLIEMICMVQLKLTISGNTLLGGEGTNNVVVPS